VGNGSASDTFVSAPAIARRQVAFVALAVGGGRCGVPIAAFGEAFR
jgi:hypothetical protein